VSKAASCSEGEGEPSGAHAGSGKESDAALPLVSTRLADGTSTNSSPAPGMLCTVTAMTSMMVRRQLAPRRGTGRFIALLPASGGLDFLLRLWAHMGSQRQKESGGWRLEPKEGCLARAARGNGTRAHSTRIV